jgi:plasmid replication initiation protein
MTNLVVIVMNDKNLIYKDNSIVQAAYKLTLIEQRLILLAISKVNAYELLSENDVFLITASEYSAMFNMSEDAAFREMKKAIQRLFLASIKVIDTPDRDEEWRWISKKSSIKESKTI